MASSQVQIASSSSPFGYVHRDHNQRDGYGRENNARANQQAAFHKNLKDYLVHNNLHSCMSGPPKSPVPDHPHENSYFQSHHANISGNNEGKPPPFSNVEDNNGNNANNRRQLKKVDRWAHAREMVISIGEESQDGVDVPPPTLERKNSSQLEGSSAEIKNVRGVSSLVQRWRDFEAESKTQQNSGNSPPCGSCRSNSGCASADNASIAEVPTRGSDAGESTDERYDLPDVSEDVFGDWESDRTTTSGPPSSQSRELDAAERERVRVADIIKKLSSANGMHQGFIWDYHHPFLEDASARIRTTLDQQEKIFNPVINSPRIRGRQAFNDLLEHMERDRHKELDALSERKSVSKFCHRGRIQALLRLRFLRRGAEVRDQQRLLPKMSETNRTAQGSTIMHLRERFDTGVGHCTVESKNSCRELVDNTAQHENSCTLTELREDIYHQDASHEELKANMEIVKSLSTSNSPSNDNHVHKKYFASQQNTQVLKLEDMQEAENPISDSNRQVTNLQVEHSGSNEPTTAAASLNGWDDYRMEELVITNQQLTGNEDWLNNISMQQKDWLEDKSIEQQLTEIDCECASDVCRRQSDCEEQSNFQLLEETNCDWINDISRPLGEWEDLRQARYLEMLDPYLDNGERRQLLERKSVTNFLSSNLRDCIDRLMVSRTQRHSLSEVNRAEVKEQNVEVAVQRTVVEEEVGDNNGDCHDEEAGSPIETSIPQIPYSTNSWVQNRELEGGEYYDQIESPSLRRSSSSNCYSQDTRQISPFMNHPSIEMELIYDLRGHIQQLRQETSALRQEVAVALSQSGKGKDPSKRVSRNRKGNCCICYKAKIDSLLYRCGHMCACFDCAHELLQWGSGKCPICQAAIMDVVRAYADS